MDEFAEGFELDIDSLLTADQVSYLAGFPSDSLLALTVEHGPCFVRDLVPVGPGLWTVAQAFAVASLVYLRKRKRWVPNPALNVAASIARKAPGDLEHDIMNGDRFCVALMPVDANAAADERQTAYSLVDADEVEMALKLLVPKCCLWGDMQVRFVDLEPAWLDFAIKLAHMNDGETFRPSAN